MFNWIVTFHCLCSPKEVVPGPVLLNEPKGYDHIKSFINTAFFWPISTRINLQFHCVNLIGFADKLQVVKRIWSDYSEYFKPFLVSCLLARDENTMQWFTCVVSLAQNTMASFCHQDFVIKSSTTVFLKGFFHLYRGFLADITFWLHRGKWDADSIESSFNALQNGTCETFRQDQTYHVKCSLWFSHEHLFCIWGFLLLILFEFFLFFYTTRKNQSVFWNSVKYHIFRYGSNALHPELWVFLDGHLKGGFLNFWWKSY